MAFVCIMPEEISIINQNYESTAQIYDTKKESILARLKQEQNISGEDFINTIQTNYSSLLKEKYESAVTGREVGLETIINHVYRAAEAMVAEVLENHSEQDVQSQIQALEQISREAGKNIEQQKKVVNKEIEKIIQQYSNETQVDRLIDEMLPKYLSQENAKLSAAQIYAYTKSMLRREIKKRASIVEIDKAVKKHPSIILGYVREDAITAAALKAIETLKVKGMSAKTIGAEQSKIDIIIPITSRASAAVQGNTDLLGTIVKQLDALSTEFVVTGESKYETDEFLGIQSKPWQLYRPTTTWNRNSVGSRAELYNAFLEHLKEMSPADRNVGWHRGVLFLSEHLQEVMGPNTVMYATGGKLIWTSDLLRDLYQKYHKYFAFMLDSNYHLTSHIQLADHYG